MRGAAQTAKRVVWKPLPATAREQERIRELARETNRPVLPARQGRAASAAQVLLDLPQARWAHFATHGFFADAAFRSYLQVDEEQFERTGRHRGTAGARSPLVLSGLVLAGANRPEQEGDRGILTAEGIASLPLQDLELAVLSACDTGRGEVAGGEGVFGLQRAFHLAGTQNVIASLWEVDDQATAALMGLFYRKLWLDKQPPLEALREAQLYLYRHPEQIAVLAQRRGADFANPKPLPSTPPRTGVATGPGKHAAVSQWAAFVLSGAGQ